MSLVDKIFVAILIWTWVGIFGGYLIYSVLHLRRRMKAPSKSEYWAYARGLVLCCILGPFTGIFLRNRITEKHDD